MRRVIVLLLTAVLAGLIAARRTVPEAAAQTMAAVSWDAASYNVLDWDLSGQSGTAGSALISEMDHYFLSCMPTAKHSRTGLLAGRSLLLVLADDWKVSGDAADQAPTLHKLWQEGIQFAEVYAPDWYQGLDGREFALLTGLTPTTVQNRSSMTLLAGQDVFLPFSLPNALSEAGYVCRAWSGMPERESAYRTLGFSSVSAGDPAEVLAGLADQGPFFAYCVLEGQGGEAALARLMQALEEAGLAGNTAVCVVAGSAQPLRGTLFLWADGLGGISVPAPCSDLDVTPTLLDLFGLSYDSRFLSGRDALADSAGPGPVPLVSLYGSAYSDWVTDAGSFIASEGVFFPLEGRFDGTQEEARYVQTARQLVYDRYVFSRRILECNYFRLIANR